MKRQAIEQFADDAMRSGHNCAESILKIAMEHCGIDTAGTPMRIATGFGGGAGRSKQELCGALAGGIMALGLELGRNNPGESGDAVCAAVATFRDRFLEQNGTTTCHILVEGFGEQENWDKCRRLVADTAGILFDLITEIRGQS